MRVADILADKGDQVVTIHPDTSLEHATRQLSDHGYGALVASEDGQVVSGILSERDIVRHIAAVGRGALDAPVRSIMTRHVLTCSRIDTVDHLMGVMTEHRIRHVPVVDDQRHMCGMISIGDVVKRRVRDLESEASELHDYLTSR